MRLSIGTLTTTCAGAQLPYTANLTLLLPSGRNLTVPTNGTYRGSSYSPVVRPARLLNRRCAAVRAGAAVSALDDTAERPWSAAGDDAAGAALLPRQPVVGNVSLSSRVVLACCAA